MPLEREARAAHARGWVLTQLRGKIPTVPKWPDAPNPTLEQLTEWAGIGNIGVLTGPRSGVIVIDVDERKGGDVAKLNLPPTPTVSTGGGGWHLYFRNPDGPKIGNSTGKLGPHVDVRGAGGQVVLPGSVHPDTGEPYTWAAQLSPEDLPFAELPAHILERLRPKPAPIAARPAFRPTNGASTDPYVQSAVDRECSKVANAAEGTRNDALNAASFNLGTLVGGGELLPGPTADALMQAAIASGLDEREAGATIRSGMLAGERAPRGVPERKARPPRPSGNGTAPATLTEAESSILRAIDLYDASVVPSHPEFVVDHLLRRSGLHLVWSQPSGGKTWTLARWSVEMLTPGGDSRLTGHPDLVIRDRYRKVLWIGTEEDAPGMRAKVDEVCRGLGIERPGGQLLHLWASAPGFRVTLDLLPTILEREGPVDLVVLDSLTGLRPKTVGGVRVKWDLDNDAANDQCLELRGLAVIHNVAIVLVHHTGRETEKGYRGPTEYWASADVMFGLVPDREAGKTKVLIQKNRDGRVLEPFFLTPNWGPSGFFLDYSGGAVDVTDSSGTVLAFLRGKGSASQNEITIGTGLSRRTVIRALKALRDQERVRDTGNMLGRSPIYKVEET